MANTFHLAVPAGDIPKALKFYKDILGCKTGNQEEGHWIDVDFWGNELTLHQTETRQHRERYNVDMAAAIIAGFPTLVVYVLAGKYFIRGLTSGAVKG